MTTFKGPLAILKERCEHSGERTALRVLRMGSRRFDSFQDVSWREFYDRVSAFARFFSSLSMPKGSRVALWGRNSIDWIAADWALMATGFVTVPLYLQSHKDDLRAILEESQTRLLLLDDPDESLSVPQINFADLEELSKPNRAEFHKESLWEDLSLNVSMDGVATIIYTSGTNGRPRGVMHSLNNGYLAITAANRRIKMTSEDRLFSYLPLSHVAERALVQWGSLVTGASVTVLDRVDRLMQYLPSAKPTIFLGVPRVWETIAARIYRELDDKWGSKLRYVPRFIRRGLLGNIIKKRLGLSEARILLSGAAKLAPSALESLQSVGLDIAQAYGLTETMGVTTCDYPTKSPGSVGPLFDGVEIRFETDGEILLRAPFHSIGYHGEEPSKADEDRWLHTGDIGQFDAKGCLLITDRKKNLFKSSNGKYIAPQPIELLLKDHPGVQEALVFGEDRPFCVALVSLVEGYTDERQLLEHIKTVNAQLAPHEQIKSLGCVRGQWGIESGEMTPTYKLKRRVVLSRFQPQIGALFESSRTIQHF